MPNKLRFAPSPTGNLHIGSVRTAIFNWVWAKALGAKLVLRIEDTDTERSTSEFEKNIMDGLNWLGIHFDEGPHTAVSNMKYRQSERIKDNFYLPYVQQLLDLGHAYYCFETDEELDEERRIADEKGIAYMYSRKSLRYSADEVKEKLANHEPYAIRFKVPDKQNIVVDDVIRGGILFESSLISDFIIVRSDGMPTYNFVVVIDDADMGITHVVRGEDHLSNTPKQMMIYQALGLTIPKFAHLPIILGPDRSKLSKRHGAKSVSEYSDDGFLPEAMINYLSLLGWSPPDEKELLTLGELFDCFDITRISKSGAIFDSVKFTWMNKQYLAKKTDTEFIALVKPFITNQEILNLNEKIITVRDNVEVLSRIDHYLEVYTQSDVDYLERVSTCQFNAQDKDVVVFIANYLSESKTWDRESANKMIDDAMAVLSLGKGKVMKPARKSLTGYDSGPNLVACLSLIPLKVLIKRSNIVLEKWNGLVDN